MKLRKNKPAVIRASNMNAPCRSITSRLRSISAILTRQNTRTTSRFTNSSFWIPLASAPTGSLSASMWMRVEPRQTWKQPRNGRGSFRIVSRERSTSLLPKRRAMFPRSKRNSASARGYSPRSRSPLASTLFLRTSTLWLHIIRPAKSQ